MDIYNSWNREYKSIFGAIMTGDTCEFSIRLSNDFNLDTHPVMVIFRNGFKERFLTMVISDKNDDYTEYKTEYTAMLTGVHYYYFTLVTDQTRTYIKRSGANKGVIGEGELFQLTVSDSDVTTPDWIKGGLYYQIFPDRFYNSGKPKENVPSDRVIRNDWGGTPFYKPDEHGHVWNNDYFCGDLAGITQKLDYIKELGVTCIYLNPVFEAHENHRYNTADYKKIDPLLGTNDDFRELCEKASQRGIRIILDGVFNHTGADSVYFNKKSRYNDIGAYNSKQSPYYPWYSFIEYPDVYESWWGIDTLPDVREDNKDFSDFICGDKGVLKYWLSMGASGFRLDVADELPDVFLDKLNRCVKQENDQNLIIGEVWEDASNKESYGVRRRYLLGEQLDSVMNYPFKDAIISYMAGGKASVFRDWIMTILENYPKQSIDCLMNFLSTHDIERALTVFGGESSHGKDKDWQSEKYLTHEQYEHGKTVFKNAMILQFFLPGVPCIYYGDEAGLQGYRDPFNRRCYPWGHEDQDMLTYVKHISKARQSLKDYMTGAFRFVECEDNYVAFLRYNSDERSALIVILNKGDWNVSLDVNVASDGEMKLKSIVEGQAENGVFNVPPKNYAMGILQVKE